ncbi:MAG: hypothetical protein E4H38_03335 [Gemmatimonadales bacterium]|nr:MAG: hypothetical protein E4H38_03335 [Gemmatimonadales bacterium]
MLISQRALAAAALALLTGVALSCSSGADNVMGTNRALVLEPGLNLLSDPATIILDPNDPSAPRDPVTQELIGSAALSAIVLGADLSPTPGVDVTFTSTAGTLGSAGQPVTTDAAGLAPDALDVSESGPSLITVTATTATETKSVDVVVDIAPVADAGDDQTVDCPDPVTLNGSGSTDANSTAGTNDDIVSFEWFLGQTKIADGEVVQVDLPVGTNVVTLKVTDKAGATATDDVTVTVVDTEAPVVTLHMSPDHLWPPNHKMKTVQAILDIQDCDPAPTVELVSVTSNEPANGLGDGNTAPDIAGADLGTDDRQVQVRSERSGTGSGRVYTFAYRVTDAAGNATDATATVTVPHDQGH